MREQNQNPQFNILYPTFFTDRANPWINATQQIKQLFSQSVQLKNLSNVFPPKNKNYLHCGYQMSRYEEDFYYCETCGVDGNTAYFCHSCYDHDFHEEHDSARVSDEGDRDWYPTCTCGIKWECCAESFCDNHGKDNEQINLKAEQVERFIQFFKPVYEILFYAKDSEGYKLLSSQIQKELIKTLGELNENCLQYIRITVKLYETSVSTSQGEDKIIKQLIKRNMHYQLFDKIKIDGIFRAKFSKYHLQAQSTGYTGNFYSQILNKTKGDLQMDQIWGEESSFLPQNFELYLRLAGKSEEGKKQFDQFIRHISTTQTMESFFNLIYEKMKGNNLQRLLEKTLFFLLEKILSYFSAPTVSYYTQTFIKLIGHIIVEVTKAKYENIVNIKEILEKNNIDQKLIHHLIPSLVQSQADFLNQNFGFVFSILLSESRQKDKLMQIFWQKFYSAPSIFSTFKWEAAVEKTYILINRILNIEKLCKEEQKRFNEKSRNLEKNENEGKNEESEKSLKEEFIKFLKEKIQIRARDIWAKKRNGELNFQNAAQTLNQFCFYNQQLEKFVLKALPENDTSELNEIKVIPLFPMNNRNQSQMFDYLYRCRINFNNKTVIQNKVCERILRMFFSPPFFLRQLKQKWNKTLEDHPNENSYEIRRLKEKQIGYVYVFFLVFASTISENPNEQLMEEIQKLRFDQTYRFPFEHLGNTSRIKRVLCLDEEKKQQGKETKEVQTIGQTLKEKAAEKKKKMCEKYKKKGNSLMKNLATKSLNMEIDGNQDICLLCHEKQKPKNQLVYMAQLCKDKILSSTYYGKDDKSSLLFKSCMHTIHLNCYTKMMKNKSFNSFNCPLCSKQMNCILPISFNPEAPRTFEICFSSITICFGINYQIFNDESLFILLFKHLVQSKGLNSLVNLNRYHLEKFVWRKFNKYVENLMVQLFEKGSQNDKNKYIQNSQGFIEDMKICGKQHLCDVQTILANTILSKIKGQNEVNISLLRKIKAYSNEEQFQIILGQLEELLQKPIDLGEEVQKGQLKGFSLKIIRPPEDTNQLKELMKNLCHFCSSRNNEYKCLICGQVYCRNCFHDHRQEHQNMNFCLYFSYMRIEYANMLGSSSSIDCYFNDFWMPYSNAYQEQREYEMFRLKERKLNEAINRFLEG